LLPIVVVKKSHFSARFQAAHHKRQLTQGHTPSTRYAQSRCAYHSNPSIAMQSRHSPVCRLQRARGAARWCQRGRSQLLRNRALQSQLCAGIDRRRQHTTQLSLLSDSGAGTLVFAQSDTCNDAHNGKCL
jgi:hypothetical protein